MPPQHLWDRVVVIGGVIPWALKAVNQPLGMGWCWWWEFQGDNAMTQPPWDRVVVVVVGTLLQGG